MKRILEKRGYKVFRSAGSKPLDLIAVSDKRIYFIECKIGPYKGKIKRAGKKIKEISEGTCAKPIVAYRDNKNKIHFYDPLTDEEIDIPYS